MEKINQSNNVGYLSKIKGTGFWLGKGSTKDSHGNIIHKGEYQKRSVMKEVTSFCGWDVLRNLVEKTKESLLVLCLFKSGGRINEVLSLERRQFEVTDNAMYIHNLPVLKKRRQTFETTHREVYIPMNEQLSEELAELLPSKEGKLFSFKYGKAYKIVTSLGKDWFPHRFRAERARQLIRDYGFDALLLKQYFNMTRIDTPLAYANPNFEAVKRKMLNH